MKIADADVGKYLRMFTLLSIEEIDQIVKIHMVKIYIYFFFFEIKVRFLQTNFDIKFRNLRKNVMGKKS
jgi:hypothetical protein